MAQITAAFVAEQIEYLKTDREFYIECDEFGGDESDFPALRLALRHAAKAEGLRVHTRIEGDALWVFDPDWHPSPGEKERVAEAHREAARARWEAERSAPAPRAHLRALN